jgi:hypothetical protein
VGGFTTNSKPIVKMMFSALTLAGWRISLDMMIVPSGVTKKCVRTRTRHRVPPTSSVIRRTCRRRRLARSAIRRTIRRALLKTRNPTCPGETPSGHTAVMGCPRSVRPPLGLRRSKLSNMKNTDER